MKRAAGAIMAATLVLVLSTPVAMAAPYGTAGCGLGSIIFGDDSGIVQVLASTTNGSTYTQTFGISSGTSNCIDVDGGSSSAKAFIQTNREALAKDIARGQGETISNLSVLAGCADPAAVGAALQADFDQIFPEASVSDKQVSESVVNSLQSHNELACGALG